ncbi:MAG: class I SAM-dependent methyltransferase [Gammaproteobacteria bacterium]|nr:class I SAM-dependent methyltransferase [Gammaproteobacteria bacterium]
MNKDKMRVMADRVFRDMAGGMAAGLAFVGTETGLFRAMQGRGAMTESEVVNASGLQARYVEEWLKGMVAASYLDYDAQAATYTLPDEHAFLLASDGTDHFMGGMFAMLPPLLAVAPRVATACRDGGGVPFADYAPECRHAIDHMNRGNYEHRLVDYWLKQLPEVSAALSNGGRMLDVGCGRGFVVLAVKKAFPDAECIGVDPDAASIAEARTSAAAAGVAARYEATTSDALADTGKFDLITLCDVLHDLPAPIPVLEGLRARLAPGGVLLVIEPRVSDNLEENINPLAAMFYGFSMFHCMTQSLAHGGAGLGACLGPTRTRALFAQAGFSSAATLDIKSPTNLFYAVRA